MSFSNSVKESFSLKKSSAQAKNSPIGGLSLEPECFLGTGYALGELSRWRVDLASESLSH